MKTKIQIKFKSGQSVIETITLPNSSQEIEVAHSSFVNVAERLSDDLKKYVVSELEKVHADNYNKDFVIDVCLSVSKKQSV